MTSLPEFILGLVEQTDESKSKQVLSSLNKLSADYINKKGKRAKEWVKKEILSKNGTWEVNGLPVDGSQVPLNEDDVKNIITHIVNGHIENVYELLWADLVFRGYDRYKADFKAGVVSTHLIYILARAHGAGEKAKIGTLMELPEKDLIRLGKAAGISHKYQRITCPNCYRIIKEWDVTKYGHDFGPTQVKCKECGHILPTHLIPWDKTTSKHKIRVFTFPILVIIAGLIFTIAYRGETACAFLPIFGTFWLFHSWRQGRESLKIPTW